MTRATYDVKEEYTGDGSLAAYTFDFKIEALTQLLVVSLDDTGTEVERVRGTDAVFLFSVDFDAVAGGGTVTLQANLETGHELILLLANDAPTQPYNFNDKNTFTLKTLTKALDFIAGAVQRLAYRGKQALRIHDNDDEETIDGQFPPMGATPEGKYLRVDDAGTGFEYGYTLAEFQDAIFPTATVANQIPLWNGAAWIAALYAGGRVISATQDIASGADIAVNAGIQQLLKVQGDGGTQTCSVSPFSGTLINGMVITLLGMSDANKLIIPYTDGVDSCLLKGNCYLGAGDTLELVYDTATRRFYELSRN